MALLIIFMAVSTAWSATSAMPTQPRASKFLPYFDHSLPEDYAYAMDDGYVMLMDENALSRTIPKGKPTHSNMYNSPIYYIRLPPQPYMFVPGFGYISQPPAPSVSHLVNLPVNFLANGKPTTIYQWTGTEDLSKPSKFPTQKPAKPQPTHDPNIYRLPGQFNFNGKPDDMVVVLRDSYNSLYEDSLQNFYP